VRVMALFSFDISGKLAHWRRFDTNSSSLTYYFPTRTNLIGLLASILEIPRNKYYKIFSSENIGIGISLKTKIRKKMTVLNYRNTKANPKEIYTQIRLELLMPENFEKNITYRIYVYLKEDANEEAKEQYSELFRRVSSGEIGFGIYFGQRQFRAQINNFQENYSIEKAETNEFTSLTRLVTVGVEDNLKFEENREYSTERIPCNFNERREIEQLEEVVSEINGSSILLNKPMPAFLIKKRNEQEYVDIF